MKKIILLLMLLCILCRQSYSQQTDSLRLQTKKDYLLKSQKQSSISFAVGVPGLIIATVGGITVMNQFGNGLPTGSGYNHKKENTGKVLLIIGCGMLIPSLALISKAKKNKKMAMSFSFKNESTPYLKQNFIVSKYNPSLSCTINL